MRGGVRSYGPGAAGGWKTGSGSGMTPGPGGGAMGPGPGGRPLAPRGPPAPRGPLVRGRGVPHTPPPGHARPGSGLALAPAGEGPSTALPQRPESNDDERSRHGPPDGVRIAGDCQTIPRALRTVNPSGSRFRRTGSAPAGAKGSTVGVY